MKKPMKRRALIAAGAAALVTAAAPKAKAARLPDGARLGDAHIKIGRSCYRSVPGKGWVKISKSDPLPHWSKLAKTPLEMELRMTGRRSREAECGGTIETSMIEAAIIDSARRVQAINSKVGIRTTILVRRRRGDTDPLLDVKRKPKVGDL